MKRYLLMATLLALFSNEVFAVTGNDLYAEMQDKNFNHGGISYVQGLVDMQDYMHVTAYLAALKNGIKISYENYICSPKDSTYGQSYDIIKNYLTNHPEIRNKEASTIGFLALSEVWACKE